MGAELDRLARRGWRVLHSIPLANNVDVDHLLIGPGGVFSINTKYHHNKVVWVGDDAVKVNHGKAGALRAQEPGGGQARGPGA